MYFLCVDICGKIYSYTDFHDVDEDETTIASCGGHWYEVGGVGVTRRGMIDSPSNFTYSVASSNMQKYRTIIRMIIMSTKICGPSRLRVDIGTVKALQVSHSGI